MEVLKTDVSSSECLLTESAVTPSALQPVKGCKIFKAKHKLVLSKNLAVPMKSAQELVT